MGIDARILFQKIGDLDFGWQLPSRFSINKHLPLELESALKEDRPSHFVNMRGLRYYSPGYERGPWTEICAVLMMLHACPGVGKVWYGGDSFDSLPECGIEAVLKISAHFMRYGERPYRERLPERPEPVVTVSSPEPAILSDMPETNEQAQDPEYVERAIRPVKEKENSIE